MSSDLSAAQRHRLHALERQDPDARVIGRGALGPLVRRGDGRLQELVPWGRLNAVREEPQA